MPDRIAPPVSDADRTMELPSADQTVTEFVPVNAAALAAVEVELEDLSDDAIAAEGTQELGGADILEVEQIAKKLDADEKIEISMDAKNRELSEVFGAISLRKPQKTLVGVGVPRPAVPRRPVPQVETRAAMPVMLPPPAPVGLPILVPMFRPPQGSFAPLPPPLPPPRSPSRYPSQPSHHPSSISPLALDIGGEPPPIESTMQIRRAAGIPDHARPELAIAAGIAAWAVMAASVALVLGGTFVGIRRHSAAKATAAAAFVAPRAPAIEAASNIPPPEEKAAEPAVEKPAAPVAAAIAAPLPAPATPRRAAPPPRGPAKPAGVAGAQTGVLRVPAGVKGVLVDGAPHRVDGGALFLPCGKHMIKAPGQSSRSVDIVCGKTVSL